MYFRKTYKINRLCFGLHLTAAGRMLIACYYGESWFYSYYNGIQKQGKWVNTENHIQEAGTIP